jgi:hypothetical protein
VSAVEEYREECAVLRRHDLPPAWMTIQMADAAIAELAAQVDHVNDLLAQAVEVNKHIGEDWVRDKEMLALLEAELAALRADWVELRSQVVAYEKSGIDLYQRENGKAFRKMMDRVLARKDGES